MGHTVQQCEFDMGFTNEHPPKQVKNYLASEIEVTLQAYIN
jgi:hypothetical protein